MSDKQLSGDDCIEKCNESMNAFQDYLSNAITAYGRENNVNGTFLALAIAFAYMQFKDKLQDFFDSLNTGDGNKDGKKDE